MVQLQVLNKVLKSKNPDIIINNDLTREHFIEYEEEYDYIMNHYRSFGNIPDMATFIGEFKDFEPLEVTETDEYLVNKLQDEYLYHRMAPVLIKCDKMMSSGSAADALDYLKSEFASLSPTCASYGVDIIKNANLRYEEYIEKRDSETPWMLPTGFPELDEHIGGLALGEEFVVIVARTNQGKSWILLKMATHICNIGHNVGYISPEMSYNAIGYRYDTLSAHFSNSDLFRGKEIPNYKEHIENLQNNGKNSFVVATPADFNKKITISKLRNFCLQCNLDALFIDGITYLSDERYKRGDNKTTSLTNISEDLMELSLELKIPIIAVVQANRSATEVTEDDATPELESIRDSDGIAHNASKVLSIRQQLDKLHICIKKNRNGPVNVKCTYRWDINHGKFEYEPRPGEYSTPISEDDAITESRSRQTVGATRKSMGEDIFNY